MNLLRRCILFAFSKICPDLVLVSSRYYRGKLFRFLLIFLTIALNYQTDLEPMHLNQGKFRTNGRAGYILKPKILKDGKYSVLRLVSI